MGINVCEAKRKGTRKGNAVSECRAAAIKSGQIVADEAESLQADMEIFTANGDQPEKRGPPHRDEVEIPPVKAADQLVQRRGLRRLTPERAHEVAVQPDRTHGDRRLTGDLLRPAREIQIRTFEFRLPEAPLGTMEHVGPSLGQGLQPGLHFSRAGGELGPEVLLLPLREPDEDREVRSNRGADALEDFGCEPCPLRDVLAAIAIGPAIGRGPEELVDEVAVLRTQAGPRDVASSADYRRIPPLLARLTREPYRTHAEYLRACLRFYMDTPEASAAAFRAFLKRHPGHALALYMIGRSYFRAILAAEKKGRVKLPPAQRERCRLCIDAKRGRRL